MTHATTLAPAAASTRLSPGALHRRLWQCAVGSVLVLLLIASSFILRDNLQRLGLSVGFDFLQRPAGFQIGCRCCRTRRRIRSPMPSWSAH